MRTGWALFSMLLLGGCSCQRESAETSPAPTPTPVADERSAAAGTAPSRASAEVPATRDANPTARTPRNAVSVVHTYVTTLLNDPERAGEFWAGGRLPPRPDDAVLHTMSGIRNLRIDNDAGIALDQEDPPQALEIPVRVRISTDSGPVILRGWYRVRPRIGSSEWEITSASLQPVLQ
jgi:hypothetical protein